MNSLPCRWRMIYFFIFYDKTMSRGSENAQWKQPPVSCDLPFRAFPQRRGRFRGSDGGRTRALASGGGSGGGGAGRSVNLRAGGRSEEFCRAQHRGRWFTRIAQYRGSFRHRELSRRRRKVLYCCCRCRCYVYVMKSPPRATRTNNIRVHSGVYIVITRGYLREKLRHRRRSAIFSRSDAVFSGEKKKLPTKKNKKKTA